MSGRLPVVSGAQLVAAFAKRGWATARQRGSHIVLRGPDGRVVVVPLHRELKRGTLAGISAPATIRRRRRSRRILRDAGLTVQDLADIL